MASPFQLRARERWPNACWITGDGPYASVSRCHDYPEAPGCEDEYTTVMLFSALAEAEAAKAGIDRMGCGGGCTKYHLIAKLVPAEIAAQRKAIRGMAERAAAVRRVTRKPMEGIEDIPEGAAHWLYRYFDTCGCLLYVGITGNLNKRDREHKRNSMWRQLAVRREFVAMSSVLDASLAESCAVRDESPVFNWRLRDDRTTHQLMAAYVLAHSVREQAAVTP